MFVINLQTIAAALAALTAVGGTYIGLATAGPPVFASHLQAKIDELRGKYDPDIARLDKVAQSTATILRDIQLQQNQARKESVRREKFDKEVEITKPDVPVQTRSMLRQRLDQLNDDEENLKREREFLEKQRWDKN